MTPWDRGRWRNPPPAIEPDGDDSLVTPACGSDLRQRTSGGLRRDSGHALLEPVERHRAVEVILAATAHGTFEQAGLLLRLDERTWVKAGVEHSDGGLQLSAVVTAGTVRLVDGARAGLGGPVGHGARRLEADAVTAQRTGPACRDAAVSCDRC